MKPSEKIAILRHKKGYSVTDIAIKLDISSYEVMDWEEGKKDVPDNQLYPLCSLLGISVSDFLDDSYIVNDDVVNHLDEEKPHLIEEPVFEKPVYEEPEEISSAPQPIEKGKSPKSRLYSQFRKTVTLMQIAMALGLFIFAFMMAMMMRQAFNGLFMFIFFFLFAYFLIALFVLLVSSGVKEYEYKGREILIFYMFVITRLYIDGQLSKMTYVRRGEKSPAPEGTQRGPLKPGTGIIDLGNEKLYYYARKLTNLLGEEIKPK